ncbi:class I SAM-dependent methyltransferase [Aurantibacillus circumpalustris]|uniref:class I SAM-dependent methyltransferase n=1 Tax=Aurantibacillus circumpalustris TaxID=3036359 RepID=UPI00295B3C37|nr:class I SAM-dependent methyltransferase [Aurantibacillus circumpalustris]
MDKNKKVYSDKKVIDWYGQLEEIWPIEKKIFAEYKNLLQSGNFLDVGVGGGRTTKYLANICKHYTGIDYSEKFIEKLKEHYPEFEYYTIDASDMSAFQDQTFDFVNFSFNGMDYVDLDNRKKIFSEMYRVLKPKGLFFFSTHNKNHFSFNINPWRNKNNSFSINIKTFLKLVPYLIKKQRQKTHTVYHKDYAIINDSAHNYELMTFYTSPAFLRRQLSDNGFVEIDYYLKSGEKKDDSQLEEWIFATAKKA